MGRLRPCPTLPAPSARPGCRPARSSFFCARVRVVDLDLATLALAHRRTRMAPGPVALPTDTRIVQNGPDRVRADVRQTMRCTPQGTLQRVQRPGRRAIPLAIWRAPKLVQDPIAFGWAIQHRWCTTTVPRHHRAQSDLVETRHPLRDRIAHRSPDELRCFRVRAASADGEYGARSCHRCSRRTLAARQPLQCGALGTRQWPKRIFLD